MMQNPRGRIICSTHFTNMSSIWKRMPSLWTAAITWMALGRMSSSSYFALSRIV